jgi:hypothetical protein
LFNFFGGQISAVPGRSLVSAVNNRFPFDNTGNLLTEHAICNNKERIYDCFHGTAKAVLCQVLNKSVNFFSGLDSIYLHEGENTPELYVKILVMKGIVIMLRSKQSL